MMRAQENPFATRKLEDLLVFDPELAGTTWEALLGRWRALNQRAAIVGPHGAGKTTFLDAFVRQIDAPVMRFFFNRESRRLSPVDHEKMSRGKGAIWIADGDRHLSFEERRVFYQGAAGAAGFLSARHRPHRYPVLLRLIPDEALAAVLLSRIDPEDQFVLKGRIKSMFRRRGGNLREVWLDCYDHAARRAAGFKTSRFPLLSDSREGRVFVPKP